LFHYFIYPVSIIYHALSARVLESESTTTTICARSEKIRGDKLNFYSYR